MPTSPPSFATLALLVIVEGAALLIWGADPQLGKPVQAGVVRLMDAVIPWQYIWNIAALVAITVALHLFLKRTWTGRAMRANAENPLMSHLLGVNVRRLGAISFGIGAAIGATAGILASPITWIDYQMGGTFMLFGLLAFLIGGESSIAGPMVGGLLLGIVENVFLLVPGVAGGLLKQVMPMLMLLLSSGRRDCSDGGPRREQDRPRDASDPACASGPQFAGAELRRSMASAGSREPGLLHLSGSLWGVRPHRMPGRRHARRHAGEERHLLHSRDGPRPSLRARRDAELRARRPRKRRPRRSRCARCAWASGHSGRQRSRR